MHEETVVPLLFTGDGEFLRKHPLPVDFCQVENLRIIYSWRGASTFLSVKEVLVSQF